VNVLVPILLAGQITDGPFAYDAEATLAPYTLDADEAAPGSVGLLSDPRPVWDAFAERATRLEAAPPEPLGMVAVPTADERVTVVPGSVDDEGEDVVALWQVDDEGLLDVVTAKLPPAPSFVESLQAALRQARRRKVDRKRLRCATGAVDLECLDRRCVFGVCGPYSWYDEQAETVMHGCACH
jgi:hypothetical protein